jgi:hypothetical protein
VSQLPWAKKNSRPGPDVEAGTQVLEIASHLYLCGRKHVVLGLNLDYQGEAEAIEQGSFSSSSAE